MAAMQPTPYEYIGKLPIIGRIQYNELDLLILHPDPTAFDFPAADFIYVISSDSLVDRFENETALPRPGRICAGHLNYLKDVTGSMYNAPFRFKNIKQVQKRLVAGTARLQGLRKEWG